MKVNRTLLKFIVYCFAYIFICYLCYEYKGLIYISNQNSLCYSWIPSNSYIKTKGLCNINCSYIREKKFPLNKPFSCNTKMKANHSNAIYSVYVFNTTTHNIFISKYRMFYGNIKVKYISFIA